MKHIGNSVSWSVIDTQTKSNESKSGTSLLFWWQKSNLITSFINCQKSSFLFLVYVVSAYPTAIPAQYILIHAYSVVLNQLIKFYLSNQVFQQVLGIFPWQKYLIGWQNSTNRTSLSGMLLFQGIITWNGLEITFNDSRLQCYCEWTQSNEQPSLLFLSKVEEKKKKRKKKMLRLYSTQQL